MAMKLVLFDIDGTLLHCGGRTREPLAEAVEEACGTAGSLRSDVFAGRTDDQIVFQALMSAGLAETDILAALPRIKRRFLEILEAQVDGSGISLLPGVPETLQRLSANESVCLGLATGNWKSGASWKLGHFDLDSYFAIGAFGDGNRDRIELPPVAVEAARRHFGQPFAARDVLIVGDTPNDVRCGHHHGIPVLTVTTGYSSRQDLEEAGADWIFESLPQAGYLEPVLSDLS
jgi:phosphoglycolate phosphatase-like HAD superfamily hydrolase